jgi:hypothetical protein
MELLSRDDGSMMRPMQPQCLLLEMKRNKYNFFWTLCSGAVASSERKTVQRSSNVQSVSAICCHLLFRFLQTFCTFVWQDVSVRLDEADLRRIWSFLSYADLSCVTDTNRRWRRSTNDARLQRDSVPLNPLALFAGDEERFACELLQLMQLNGPEVFHFVCATSCFTTKKLSKFTYVMLERLAKDAARDTARARIIASFLPSWREFYECKYLEQAAVVETVIQVLRHRSFRSIVARFEREALAKETYHLSRWIATWPTDETRKHKLCPTPVVPAELGACVCALFASVLFHQSSVCDYAHLLSFSQNGPRPALSSRTSSLVAL